MGRVIRIEVTEPFFGEGEMGDIRDLTHGAWRWAAFRAFFYHFLIPYLAGFALLSFFAVWSEHFSGYIPLSGGEASEHAFDDGDDGVLEAHGRGLGLAGIGRQAGTRGFMAGIGLLGRKVWRLYPWMACGMWFGI
jgi:hypothetical protein